MRNRLARWLAWLTGALIVLLAALFAFIQNR